jgi:hypothetical protein
MADRAVLNASVSPSVEEKVLAEANRTSAAILGLDIAKVERMVKGIQNAMDILPQFKAAA